MKHSNISQFTVRLGIASFLALVVPIAWAFAAEHTPANPVAAISVASPATSSLASSAPQP